MDVLLEQLKNLINEYGDLKIATALDTMLRSNEIFFAPENFNGVQYIDYSLTGMLLLSGSVDYGYVAEFDQGRLIQASPYTALNGGFISNGGLDLTANFGRIEGVGFDDFFGWGSSISVSGSFMGIGFTGGSAIVGASGNNPQNIYEGESYGIETTTRKLVPNSVGYTAFPADVSLMSGYTWAAEKDVFGLGM